MKLNRILFASFLALAMVGSAHAGIKNWVQNKTQALRPQAASQPSNGSLTTAECDAFWQGVSKGTIQATAENQRKGEACQSLMANTAKSSTPAPAAVNGQPKTLETVEVQGQRPPAKPDMNKVKQASGKGCGFGGLLGAVVGVDPTVACAAGAAIGGALSYNKQLKQARAVEAAAKEAGVAATVETRQVVDNKGKQHEELKTLTVPFDPVAVISNEPKTKKLMDKIADLTAKSTKVMTFRFEGPVPGCSAPLVNLQGRGVLAKHKVEDHCGQGNTYLMTITQPAD